MIAFVAASKPASTRSRAGQGGFSLLEIFVMVAIIATIATLALSLPGSYARQSAKNTKLQADVVLLNQMISLYLADGGSLTGVTTAQAVLDHLKRARPTAEANRQAGVASGRFVDVRLVAINGTGPLPTGQSVRAVWNSTTMQFELVGTGASGADEFDLDETLTSVAFPLDTRQTSVKQFNGTNGWVWGSTSSGSGVNYVSPSLVTFGPASGSFDPTVPVGSGSGGSGSGGSGSGGSGGSGGSPAVPPIPLPAPVMTPTGGSFAYADFPSTVTISTDASAPSGQFTTMYRVNGGAWQTYSSAVPVTSGTLIDAQNVATTIAVVSSGVNSQSYYRLVTNVAGSGAGSWVSPVGGAGLVDTITPGDPTTSFAHGNTRLDLGNGQYIDAGIQNTLTFTKNDFTGVTPNVPFSLGTLVMLNGTTFNSSEASSVVLHLNLTFTNPPATQGVDIPLTLISTPNTSDRLASADIVQLAAPDAGVALTVDGVSYNLQLSWMSLDPSAGVVQGSQFLIFEGASATAQLQGTLVPNH